jgi:hypothetical protein
MTADTIRTEKTIEYIRHVVKDLKIEELTPGQLRYTIEFIQGLVKRSEEK